MPVSAAKSQSRRRAYVNADTATRAIGVAISTNQTCGEQGSAARRQPGGEAPGRGPGPDRPYLARTPMPSKRPSADSKPRSSSRRWRRGHLALLKNISAATSTRTTVSSTLSHLAGMPPARRRPAHDPSCTPSTAGAASERGQVPPSVIDDGAAGRRHADHEGAGRGGRPHRNTAPGVEGGHFQDPAAEAQERRHVARRKRGQQGGGETRHPVRDHPVAFLVEELAAEQSRAGPTGRGSHSGG